MTITEFAILAFKSPPDFSDPTLDSLFHKLSAWQSECSGFPLLFFTNLSDPLQVHLITGWESVAAHEAWIRGERNQELLQVFAPYVDVPNVRMVHVDVDFDAIPGDTVGVVVERFGEWPAGAVPTISSTDSGRSFWSLLGRDLAREGGDVFRFYGIAGDLPPAPGGSMIVPVEQWILKRVNG